MKRSWKRRNVAVPVVALAVVAGGLVGCAGADQADQDSGSASSQQESAGRTESHASRARSYDSLKAIAKDSAVVVVGTAGAQTVADDIIAGKDYTRTTVAVTSVLKHKGKPPTSGSVIVRQDGSADQPPSSKLLEPGKTYMLFLTESELPGELASHYYVTGANAGLYVDAANATPVAVPKKAEGVDPSVASVQKLAPGTFVPLDPSSIDILPDTMVPADVEAIDISAAG